MRLWLLKPREINVLPHIFHSQEMEMEKKGNRQQCAALIVELILCIICKLTGEIEMAIGKEEHFKVVKGQVKNHLLPFHFTAATE